MYIKNYPKSYDVVVVGGGTAGVFAAIAAARSGARTLLTEKNSMLGGTMIAGDVPAPGLFFAWGRRIIGGPCWEVMLRTIASGGAAMPPADFPPRRHWEGQIGFNRFVYLYHLNCMCEESGVDVLTNAMLSGVSETADGAELIIACKEGLYRLETPVCIDATGDASLTVMAGYRVKRSDVQQPATLRNRLTGYDTEGFDADEVRRRAESEGFPGYITGELLVKWLYERQIDLHIPCADSGASESRTALGRDAVRGVFRVLSFYRGIKGLENTAVDSFGSEVGVRETNRIDGEYEITVEDYLGGRWFEDSVCYAYYPVDLHVMDGIRQEYHSKNVVAKIPYRALLPKGSRRILCAGRALSSDVLANSGLRVQAPCMAMGQAAGCAAAIAAARGVGVRDVEYGELCRALEAIDAIVPEKGAFSG